VWPDGANASLEELESPKGQPLEGGASLFGRMPGVPAAGLLLVYVRVVLFDLFDDCSKGRSRLELRNIQTSVMPLLPVRLGDLDLKHSLSFC